MVIAEREASTLDEYQGTTWPQIKHRGYCYFPFQENPQIATQSSGILWANQTPENYLCIIQGDTGGTISHIIEQHQQSQFNLPIELSYEQISLLVGNYYPIRTLFQVLAPTESAFDTVSTKTPHAIIYDSHIERIMLNFLKSFAHEIFDSDISDYFTNALTKLALEYGIPVINVIRKIISNDIINHDMTNELLKALGRIEDSNTKEIRFNVLMNSLNNDSATIRDGAVSGLSFLDDKRSLSQLRVLYENETAPIFKRNIEVAIENLEM